MRFMENDKTKQFYSMEHNNNPPLESLIEALLFVSGEPLSLKKMAKILKSAEKNIQDAILKLQQSNKEFGRGLNIINIDDAFQLTAISEASPYLTDFIKDNFNEELTPASLETLSIIAYRGPLTRFEIENIRGVNSSYILRQLSIRGLVAKEPSPKNLLAYQYKISFEFLKHLGLNNISELPNYDGLSKPLPQEGQYNQDFIAPGEEPQSS